jgi:RNA polymerase sigma-70 factor (ECF subfamily)
VTASIESIYRQHRNGLFTLALSITGRADSAEDAVHDAVVRVWRGATPGGDPVAYLFAAVRNAAIDVRRRPRLGGDAVSIFDLAEPAAGETGDAVVEAERDGMIADALAELPEDQREAVVMHLFAGLTFAQAAEAAGVPLQTVASRYRRGLEKLRGALAGLG